MIRRKQPPTVTNESYKRWLRAQRPSWAWFFGLTELEQEQLAIMGDEQIQDIIISLGYAIQDPALADASIGASQGEARGEEELARRMVDGLAARLLTQQHAEQVKAQRRKPVETLAGFGSRQQATSQQPARKRPQLFGRPADEEDA